MRPRPDLLDDESPGGIEVVQLTHEEGVPGSHVYMEAQIFTPDSKHFVLHRSAHAHGSDKTDPEHRYLVCDVDEACALRPVTDEAGATAPSVAPDGRHLYYFVDETEPGGGRLTLRRVAMDGSARETLMVIDSPLPGTDYRPSRIYPLSTISSDGKRIALSCFLGDGKTGGAPWGLMVFDPAEADVRLILEGTSWCNVHPQYCRSFDVEEAHDILVQENHGCEYDARGSVTALTGGAGADIHVIRDDGTSFRNMPWGRDGNERCQGHQCWVGRSTRAITSTATRRPKECQLIEGLAAPHAGHVGVNTPGGVRNDLSRAFPDPQFCHFATDIEGSRLITDADPRGPDGRLFLAELPGPGGGPVEKWTYLLKPRSSCKKEAHIHPFLSPDGSMGFFNSDESGILQAYVVRGLGALQARPGTGVVCG